MYHVSPFAPAFLAHRHTQDGKGKTHLARDEDLRHFRAHGTGYLGDGRDLHAGADDDDEVDGVHVVVAEALEEVLGEVFEEERDVGLFSDVVSRCFDREVAQ